MLCHLAHQPAHVGTLDADAVDRLRFAARADQVDLRLPGASDVNMGGFMIEGVDHEPEAVGAVDDNHEAI